MKEVKAEINEDVKGVAHAAYNDILHPSMNVVGKVLGTTLEFFLTPFAGLQLVNDKVKENIKYHLQRYSEKLQQMPKEQQCNVHPELGVPILQHLSYTTNEDIANLFVELLASASNINKVGLAHPSFISIIDRLSPDEARLLKYIAENEGNVLYVNFRAKRLKEKSETVDKFDFDASFVELEKWNTIVTRDLKLDFPDNLHMYWANLISCGLLLDGGNLSIKDADDKYNEIAEYNRIVEVRKKNVPMKFREIQVHRSFFQITALGAQFLEVCMENI